MTHIAKTILSEIVLSIEGIDPLELYGEKNSKLNLFKNAFPDLKITSRGDSIKIKGNKKDSQKAKAKMEQLISMLKTHKTLSRQNVLDLLNGSRPYDLEQREEVDSRSSDNVIVYARNGKAIKARTRNQKKMVVLSEKNDILFAVGPAGTGKTYTAVALAVRALKNRLVQKIILTRPAVEAGENLGFLPGDLKDKIDPYLRPLYDALDDMLPIEKLNQFIANRIIEVAPLAFMRGRTLDNAFIILDEAQNSTSVQIKMFLTRLGPNAKCIITGDLSQIDLPRHQKSGLIKALDILDGVEGIGKIFLDAQDVVRHRLVRDIIIKYDEHAKQMREKKEES